jgi:hypothetical protein
MSSIKFVSHEEFTEDQYTKEMVYLLIDDKYRVCYVRKQAKNGGLFWSVPTLSVTKDGVKAYYECFLQDSAFLEKDIKKFLDDRLWEKGSDMKKTLPTEEEIPF